MTIKFDDSENSWYVINTKGKLIAGPFDCDEDAKKWIFNFIQYN